MIRLVLISLVVLSGCTTERSCREACAPNSVLSVDSHECKCSTQQWVEVEKVRASAPPRPIPQTFAEKFCEACAKQCGSTGMAKCMQGTWGSEECWCGKATQGQDTKVEVELAK